MDAHLADACSREALAILRELPRDYADGSLRGSAASLLLAHAAGPRVRVLSARARARLVEQTVASIASTEATFEDGLLGSAWALALTEGRLSYLDAVDAAVMQMLNEGPWDGAVGILSGGLGALVRYGAARVRTGLGSVILDTCGQQFRALARRDGRAIRWNPPRDTLPIERRRQKKVLRVINMEGSAGAVSALATIVASGSASYAPLLVMAARTLAADAMPDRVDGIDRLGVSRRHHDAGTWSLGSAGIVAALISASSASASRALRMPAKACAEDLANLDPDLVGDVDASLFAGSAGLACTLHAGAQQTESPRLLHAAEYWYGRTLRLVAHGRLYFDVLRDVDGGGTRQPLTGLVEGSAGTALALLCAAGREGRRARAIVGAALGLPFSN